MLLAGNGKKTGAQKMEERERKECVPFPFLFHSCFFPFLAWHISNDNLHQFAQKVKVSGLSAIDLMVGFQDDEGSRSPSSCAPDSRSASSEGSLGVGTQIPGGGLGRANGLGSAIIKGACSL